MKIKRNKKIASIKIQGGANKGNIKEAGEKCG
jgi:hypothetical protein